jgi:hypothetical protein
MLAAGLLLPPLTDALGTPDSPLYLNIPNMYDWDLIALFLLMVPVVVWAATAAGRERLRQSYAGVHFPLHPAWSTLNTFLIHGAIALLIGLNFSRWVPKLAEIRPLPLGLLVGVLFVGSLFALSFIVSLTLSPTAGIVAGICWLCAYHEGLLGTYITSPLKSTIDWTICLAAALFVLATFLLSPRQLSLTRRIIACIILGFGTLGLPLYNGYLKTWFFQPSSTNLQLPARIYSTDGSLAVEVMSAKLHFIDYRQGRTATRALQPSMQPIGFVGRRTVIVAEQRPGERGITLLCWDTTTNDMIPLLTIPTKRGALAKSLVDINSGSYPSFHAEVSPDSRYILLALPTQYGDAEATNLWLVDFQKAHVKLILPMSSPFIGNDHSWQENSVVISGGRQPLKISLATGQVSSPPIPTPKEEGR